MTLTKRKEWCRRWIIIANNREWSKKKRIKKEVANEWNRTISNIDCEGKHESLCVCVCECE